MRKVRALAVLAVVAPWAASAEVGPRALDVSVDGPDLPFSLDDLDQALGARVTSAPGRVTLVAAGDGLLLRVRDRERTLALGERRGADAARIVAQHIGDLLLEAPAGGLPAGFRLEARHAAPRVRPVGPLLAVWPSLGVSYNRGSERLFSLALDLDLPLWQRWRAAAQVALSSTPSYEALTLRPAVGAVLGPLALRAGPVGALVRVQGETAFAGGAHAAILARFLRIGPLQAVAEIGADYYLNPAAGPEMAHADEPVPRPPGEEPQYDPFADPIITPGAVSSRLLVRAGVGIAWRW